jgi:hypothetical protein
MIKRNAEIVLGFFVATIFWIAVLGWITSYVPTEVEKQECQQAAKKRGGKPEECKTFWEKTTSDPIAFYGFWTFVFTAVVGVSTTFLWRVTRTSADAALLQANVMMAAESPMPIVVGLKLTQYAAIPGEIVVVDPVPGGHIPTNCRIMIAIENKGRNPCKMAELCVEKFAGLALPARPNYAIIIPWGLVLEKGPIWLRPDDAQSHIAAAEVGAAAAAINGGGAFWVHGYFAYWNLLNEKIVHKFALRWDLTQGFVREDRPGYA